MQNLVIENNLVDIFMELKNPNLDAETRIALANEGEDLVETQIENKLSEEHA